MKTPRIAIIGDTELRSGRWTDSGAIAIGIAASGDVEIGLRTVAADDRTAGQLRSTLESAGVVPWVSVRGEPRDPQSGVPRAEVRMGDPLQIPSMFDRDVVVLACRDARLRRFLADLPVHTRPDVRIIACLALDRGPVNGERLEDLLRFDTLIGGEKDFQRLSGSPAEASGGHPLTSIQRRMRGSNLRAVIAWGAEGAFSVAERDGDILSIPPVMAARDVLPAGLPERSVSAGWPAFVGAVAIGIANREPWPTIGHRATNAWARPSYT